MAFLPPFTPIRLRPESLPFTPKEFYVAAVTDQRPNRGPVARLALTAGSPTEAVDLEGGVTASIQQFINQSLKQNRKLRPLAMRLTECRLIETATGNRVEGKFTFGVAFDLLSKNDFGDATTTRLTEYRSSANYTRPISQTTVIEPTIRQAVIASLRNVNEYMNRQAGQNEKLATGITVNFKEDTRITTDDTVFYNLARPLTWNDFLAVPRKGSHYAAEVFTSFAYEGSSTVKNGTINLSLALKTYMLKESSWVRDEARNGYTLNHEQRHFDITKIIVERFKRRIQPDSLSLEDYNSIVQYQFIEAYRDMNRMQKQYDDETRHGQDPLAQERWNLKIDAELRTFGVKK
ncbi:hypothetical protein [Fibrisoma limi]|nr:hypothetical protein [Fibrisoma limi]